MRARARFGVNVAILMYVAAGNCRHAVKAVPGAVVAAGERKNGSLGLKSGSYASPACETPSFPSKAADKTTVPQQSQRKTYCRSRRGPGQGVTRPSLVARHCSDFPSGLQAPNLQTFLLPARARKPLRRQRRAPLAEHARSVAVAFRARVPRQGSGIPRRVPAGPGGPTVRGGAQPMAMLASTVSFAAPRGTRSDGMLWTRTRRRLQEGNGCTVGLTERFGIRRTAQKKGRSQLAAPLCIGNKGRRSPTRRPPRRPGRPRPWAAGPGWRR